MNYMIIDDQNTIINMVVLLPEMAGDWTLPDGQTLLPYEEGAIIGDVLIDGVWTTPVVPGTTEGVVIERTRRLESGFDYTFPDDRGSHHFATTPDDMLGWSAVDTSAKSFIAVGLPDQVITLVTDTGQVTVTALEWQSVMVSAAMWQQPIWQASFTLQEMDPIPADFADDVYWT